MLEQHKEPALSRDLRELIVPGSARPLPLPKAEDPAALSPEEIIAFADAAGIIDERDSLPLGEKLRAARRDGGTAMVVADAIDDEPYVSSQLGPLFKLSSQAVGGLLFAATAAGAKEIIDIGQRVCDSSTMIEAALRLGLEELLESERFEKYQREVATNTRCV